MGKYSKVKIRSQKQSKRVAIGSDSKPKIDDSVLSKWQSLLDTLADVVNVPAALIMRLNENSIEVFLKSKAEGNPYHVGEEVELVYGLYCETVIGTQQPLIVPDATKSDVWKESNPDVDINMISYLGYPLNWPDGEVFGTVCLLDSKENHYSKKFSDLLYQIKENIETDLKLLLANSDLQKKNDELEQLNETKTKFLSLISHDVRGGVGILDEFLKLIIENLEQYETKKLKGILQTLSQNASSTYLTLDNLLNWSKNDISKLEPLQTRFNIVDLLSGLIDYFEHAAKIKKLEITTDFGGKEIVVEADENMMRVSLRNILSNAIKFTPSGGRIDVAVYINSENECTIEIADTGIGMDDAALKKLFSYKNFNNRKGTEGEESAGIGLVLAKEFFDKNGANVEVESEVTNGTRFTIKMKSTPDF